VLSLEESPPEVSGPRQLLNRNGCKTDTSKGTDAAVGQTRPKTAQAAVGQTHPKATQTSVAETCPKAAQAAIE
jgi:hypothetical protein